MMRIADVLKHNDDDVSEVELGGADSAESSLLPPPRLPGCLFSSSSPLSVAVRRLRKGTKKTKKETNRCVDSGVRSKSSEVSNSSSQKKLESETEAAVDSSTSGQHTKDVSFTIGLGVGLAVLTAASKNELNKMMKLRLEMETLLKEVKNDLQRKDAISMPSKSSDILASSTTSFAESRSTNEQSTIMNGSPFYPFEKTTNITDCDSCLKCGKAGKEDLKLGVDQLEAEVQAELERLQSRLDAEEFSEPLQQQCSEPQIVKSASHEESFTDSLGEVEDPDGWGWEQENGVCPTELKRRLHELLEERQQEKISGHDFSSGRSSFGEIDNTEEPKCGEQNKGISPNKPERRLHELLGAIQEERIKELESDLEHFKYKLHQKELEVSWWKDVAKLISQHVTDAVHLSRLNQDIFFGKTHSHLFTSLMLVTHVRTMLVKHATVLLVLLLSRRTAQKKVQEKN